MTIIGVDNSKKKQKLELRWKMLSRLGGVEGLGVLETHGGRGVMYKDCYLPAKHVMRFDVNQERDNVIYCPAEWAVRAIDLQQFNVFDVDPYRSPWEIVWVISQRRKIAPGERIGIVVTDGYIAAFLRLGKTLQKAGFSTQMLHATGWPPDGKSEQYMTSAQSQYAARSFFTKWFDCEMEWFATFCGGATVNYHACVLRGRDA
jgi:hypothetical protein